VDIRPEPIIGDGESTDEDGVESLQQIKAEDTKVLTPTKEEKPQSFFRVDNSLMWIISGILVFIVVMMVVLGVRMV
jgi:hypothetical protein